MIFLLLACSATDPYAENPAITNHVEDWRDEVIYQVIVDRFANGDVNNDFNVTHDVTNLTRHMGGDYQGLMDRVDYLEALGVTAIWISPVVVNVEEDAGIGGYHGYWAQDFTNVNPHFGDLARLRELVDVMHQHNIKVIVDIVVNHVGQLFYYDINQNGQADITTWYATDGSDTLDVVTEWDPAFDDRGIQSFTSLGEAGPAPIGWVNMPEINRVPPVPVEFWNNDWYKKKGRVTDWSNLDQVQEGDFPGGLKDLETLNPNVQNALIQVYSDWITKTNIDGYRIDTVKHVEYEFWPIFCGALRAHAASLGKENFILFGEVFDGDDALIGSYTQDGMLDSAAYFSQKYQVMDGVFKYGAPTSTVQSLYELRATNWGSNAQEGGIGLSPQQVPVHFLDNHDVARFLSDGTVDQLKLALSFLLTAEGLPVLYYGTEQGFTGANDPANREPLWPTSYATDGELFQWIAALNDVRAGSEALRRGTMQLTWTTDHTGDEPDAGILAFERTTDEGAAVVILNAHPSKASSTTDGTTAMTVSLPAGTQLTSVFPPDQSVSYTVSSSGELLVEVAPMSVVVLATTTSG